VEVEAVLGSRFVAADEHAASDEALGREAPGIRRLPMFVSVDDEYESRACHEPRDERTDTQAPVHAATLAAERGVGASAHIGLAPFHSMRVITAVYATPESALQWSAIENDFGVRYVGVAP
jgi:hypothetical protein